MQTIDGGPAPGGRQEGEVAGRPRTDVPVLVRGIGKVGEYSGQGCKDRVKDFQNVKKPVVFGAESVPGPYHYDDTHDPGPKSCQEYG